MHSNNCTWTLENLDLYTNKSKNIWIKEKRAYRDGIRRKGDKIGMVSVVSS